MAHMPSPSDGRPLTKFGNQSWRGIIAPAAFVSEEWRVNRCVTENLSLGGTRSNRPLRESGIIAVIVSETRGAQSKMIAALRLKLTQQAISCAQHRRLEAISPARTRH